MSTMEESLDRIHAKKQAQKEARENATPQKLVIERTPNGLYFVRNERSGPIPHALHGTFTSIEKLRTMIAIAGKEIAE